MMSTGEGYNGHEKRGVRDRPQKNSAAGVSAPPIGFRLLSLPDSAVKKLHAAVVIVFAREVAVFGISQK